MKKNQITVPSLADKKRNKEKIVFLTAYDFFTAQHLDRAGVDGILVGDSVNMVVYGRPNTLSLPLDQIIYHAEAVSRAVSTALVVADLPFMSYQPSHALAIKNAGRFLSEGGVQAVKIEGGIELEEKITRLVAAGIPVMGHIGLTPQSIWKFGGYKARGRRESERNYLMESALALQEAGCFAIVLEAIKKELATEITSSLTIPTIGIGSGAGCDGQIMVINDILGMDQQFQARFVRRYFNLAEKIREVAAKFIADVKSGSYPSEDESY